MNWEPLSEDMSKGVPKCEIQCLMRARAHSVVEVLLNGMTSGQRVVRSMIVRMCENPSDGGNGPTMSMCIWLNLFDGTGMLITGVCTCDCILDDWHARHSFVHWLTCFLSPCQTNFCETSLTVDFQPGCARLWMA